MDKLFDPQARSSDNLRLDRQRHLGIEQDAQDADDPQAGPPDNLGLDRQRHLGIEQDAQDTQDADETPGGNSNDSSTADTSVSQPSAAPKQRLSNYAEMEDFLRKQMQDIKVETPEERAARERREKQKGFLARLADGLGSFHRAFSYARGVQPMDLPNMSAKAQERFERAKAAREADRDKYVSYALKIGDLKNDEDRTMREIAARAEAQRLANLKNQREEEEHKWKQDLQPYIKKEAEGKATVATQKGITAKAEADHAPAFYGARVKTELARQGRYVAGTRKDNAAAAKIRQDSAGRFIAYSSDGVARAFRTEAEAEYYARQQGTWQADYVDVTSTNTKTGGFGGKQTTTTTKQVAKGGHSVKPKAKKAKNPMDSVK